MRRNFRSAVSGIFILATISHSIQANAHEAMSGWAYPLECCSDKDCAEYPAENVTIVGDGFQLKEGDYIPRAKARISPDGHYHICRYNTENSTGAMITSRDVPCFWYPPQGM